ncbi:MAG TPA: hypothetical protein VEK76_01685 [Candidatus Binatia bacterium]|nr:hypothetical protein [Candidatus Binatia bacterium]
MSLVPRSRRRGELGLVGFRGCCIGLVALALLGVAVAVLTVRLTATPDLGAAPGGTVDGQTPVAIGNKLAGELATRLRQSSSGEAVITVSERDLTVLAATENPDPQTFTQVQVRSQSGSLLVSAHSHLGPLPVLITVRLIPELQRDGSVAVRIEEMDVGDQAIPGFMQSAVDPRGNAAFSLSSLLNGTDLSTFGLDCLAVVPGGVDLGFHSPFAPTAPGLCPRAATAVA